MKQDCVSIIVPIYNSAKYLSRCIDSLVNQKYRNIEIILVDDGSTDDSLSICMQYQKKDNRIKIIHKINGGLSSARNSGLECCSGKYISFIDADDSIEDSYIEKALHLFYKYKADIICYLMEVIPIDTKDRKRKQADVKTIPIILNNFETMKALIDNKEIDNSVCNKVFSKKIFDSLRFKEGIKYEDAQIIHHILSQSNTTVLYNQRLYKYYLTKNSITRNTDFSYLMDNIYSLDDRLSFYKKNYGVLYSACLENYVNVCFDILIRLRIGRKYKKEIKIIEEKLMFIFEEENNLLSLNTTRKIEYYFSNKTIFYVKNIFIYYFDKVYVKYIYNNRI